jgi:endonuclease/exonuclease/phosphatase family metal-dependent hydrolase
MRRLLVSLVLTIGPFSPAFAQEFSMGDTVRLVGRDIHIPAHPAAGDDRVPFRFTGESTAQILGIDPATGWLQIQGEKVGGEQEAGWITPRYIAERVAPSGPTDGDGQPPLPLAWCPPKGSPDPDPSGRLRIATWNLGNLHAVDGQSTFTGGDPSVQRFAIDYERIKCYVRLFDPDVLAVQEVDGEAALERVVDTDVYDLVVSKRPKPGDMNGQQNTGFAFKRGLNVQPRNDFEDLAVSNGSLRYGTRIDLTHQGRTFLLLMSIHLKSGCFDNDDSGSACEKLFTQIPVLERWMDEAAGGPHPLIVLGDFNRRFNRPQGLIWTNLNDAEPPNADLTAVTEHTPISCRDNEFPEFIDHLHLVFDKRAIAFVDRTSFRHVTYRQANREVWDKISDHCPVVVEMWVQ